MQEEGYIGHVERHIESFESLRLQLDLKIAFKDKILLALEIDSETITKHLWASIARIVPQRSPFLNNCD